MGIYDRDYERSYDTGCGWRDSGYGGGGYGGGAASWSATTKLLVTLVVVFVLQVMTQAEVTPGRPGDSWVTRTLALPEGWLSQPWRVYSLVTYGLLHNTANIAHLLGNGLLLWCFGTALERRHGGREFVAFFLAAVVLGGVVWSLSELGAAGPPAELIGASAGAVACVVLFVLHDPRATLLFWGVLPVPAWAIGTLIIASDVFGALRQSGEVAFTAHLGGALFAYLYHQSGWRLGGWLPALGSEGFKMPRLTRPRLRVHAAEEDEQGADEGDDARLDRVLEKINRSGKDSLTREEKRYLEEASRRYQQKRNK